MSNELKKIIIHISGKLDPVLSAELLEKLSSISHKPSLVLLNFENLDSIQLGSIDYLPQVFAFSNHDNISLGVCNIKENLFSQFELFFHDYPIRFFDSIETAKVKMEENLKDSIYKQVHLSEPIPIPEEPKIVRCLSCGVKLRIKGPGNYQCPACKVKFTAKESMELIPRTK